MKYDTAIDRVIRDSVISLCQKIDSSASLSLALKLKYNCDFAVATAEIAATDYTNAESFAKDYLCVNILRKWPGLRLHGVDPEDNALAAWKASEEKCKKTNEIFRHPAKLVKSSLHPILYRAQMKIANVLGDLRVFDILEKSRWGSGASLGVTRKEGLEIKISVEPTVTSSCLPYAQAVVAMDPVWFESVTGFRPVGPYSVLPCFFKVVAGEEFFTVPKDAVKHRCCGKQPTMNGFFTSRCGSLLKTETRSHWDQTGRARQKSTPRR